MADLYLYEFLYRGRAPGSAEPPDYHVILALDAKDPFSGATTTTTSQAMTPAQATEKGFDVHAIVAAIDAGTMAENAGLKTQLAEARQTLEASTAKAAALQAEIDARPLPEPVAEPEAAPAA